MDFHKPSSNTQQPSSCLSCHILGISSASALGAYMFYQAKQAKTTSHRFTCAFFGLGKIKFYKKDEDFLISSLSEY